MPPLTPLARTLRRNQTDAERKMWRALRGRQLAGYKFRRQYPIQTYIVDFVCLDARLVIELDGGQHADRIEADANRTRALEACGFHVVRFWNHEVIENCDGVLDTVLAVLKRQMF